MAIDITNISYLSFRMAPFIIVCYFVLQSLLNWDVKGIIYLAGLLFCSVAIIMLNGPMKYLFPREISDTLIPNPKCSVISLGDNGTVLSAIPLSIAVYSYTFFYLFIFILNLGNSTNNTGILGELNQQNLSTAFRNNIPIMIIFPMLLFLESVWIINNNCVWKPVYYILTSTIVGGIVGVLWAILVTSLKNNNLMYLSNAGVEVCSRPSKTYFSCRIVPKTVTSV
jgi:hypothetical protein